MKLSDTAHGVWRLLPRRLRRAGLFSIARALAPKPEHHATPPSGPVVVAGFLSSATGLGEAARLNAQALRQAGYPVATIDLSVVLFQAPRDLPYTHDSALDPIGPGTLLLHVNGPFVALALARLGRRLCAGKRIIGYWAWELPRLPSDWLAGFAYVDEIWVPSRFTAAAVAAPNRKPVRVVPHPVPPLDLPGTRDDGVFRVFTAFNMASSFARKNPLATVDAFRRAFPEPGGAELTLICNHPEARPDLWQQLNRHSGAGITLIGETVARSRFLHYLAEADAVLSLHRAEGFGLLCAEAMRAGKPVIATAWSGPLDFLTGDNSLPVDYRLGPAVDAQHTYHHPSMRWAEPDIAHAAAQLQRLAGDAALRRRLGLRAQQDAEQQFGIAAFARRVAPALPTLSNSEGHGA